MKVNGHSVRHNRNFNGDTFFVRHGRGNPALVRREKDSPIFHYCRADPFGTKNFQHVLANVYYDGQVLLSSPSAFKVYCGMDFGKWPHDEQTCVIEFESFTNDGTRVDLQMMGGNEEIAVEVSNYSSSNTWRIVGAKAMKQVRKYDCCQGVSSTNFPSQFIRAFHRRQIRSSKNFRDKTR